jgi:hypothetical protein
MNIWSQEDDVYIITQDVMCQYFLKNIYIDVYKVCLGVYNQARWISFWKLIYGLIQIGVYHFQPYYQDSMFS